MRVAAVLSLALLAAVAADTAPQQIHLAFAGADASGNSNGMTVSWTTMASTATSTVKYGSSPSQLTSTATGSAVSYLEVGVAGGCCGTRHPCARHTTLTD